MQKNWQIKIAIAIFVIFTLTWLPIQFSSSFAKNYAHTWGNTYGIMALWGGVCGLFASRKWGGIKTVIGRAMFFFSLGLLAQEFGQITYSYYVDIQHIAIPYPSIGDIGYFGSIPLYIMGTLSLAGAAGARIKLKYFGHKLQAVLIPIIILIIGYILFLQGYKFDWSQPIKIFLDFGYPFGQAIYISIAIVTYLLSKNLLGGLMKSKILFILVALCVQFLSDYTFLYNSSKGTYIVGGINDYMYLCAYFLMTIGLLQFNTILAKLRKSE